MQPGGLPLHNQGAVQMLAALRRQIDARPLQHGIQTVKHRLGHLQH